MRPTLAASWRAVGRRGRGWRIDAVVGRYKVAIGCIFFFIYPLRQKADTRPPIESTFGGAVMI